VLPLICKLVLKVGLTKNSHFFKAKSFVYNISTEIEKALEFMTSDFV